MLKSTEQAPAVLFVCEHGSAKSVVAAAHFNRLASERNLDLRAISRGTDPDQEISPGALKGLQADGLELNAEKPERLSEDDLAGAVRVVTFCQLPEAYSNTGAIEQWNDMPPVSEDYNKARDAIIGRITSLLDELRTAN
jgi:protein-tyrosine-phosphatase